MTTRTARRFTASAVLGIASIATVMTGGAASADIQPKPQSDYVDYLLARAEAAKPYSQGEDYVRTLVYWHNHQEWGLGS